MIIPKVSTDNFTLSPLYGQPPYSYDTNFNADLGCVADPNPASGGSPVIYLPITSTMGTPNFTTLDLSAFTTYRSQALVNNRVYGFSTNVISEVDFTYQVSQDLTSAYGTNATFTPTSTVHGPYSIVTFTYDTVSRVFGLGSISNAVAGTSDGCLVLGGQLSSGAGHDIVFAIKCLNAGGAFVQKCFLMPEGHDAVVIAPGYQTGILATVPYGSGPTERFKSLVRVNSGNYYIADWAPTSIKNTEFDATVTPITLSDPIDQAFFSNTVDVVSVASLSSPYGVFLSGVYQHPTGTYNTKYLQFDSSLSFYREITVDYTAAPPTGVLSPVVMPDCNGRLLVSAASLGPYSIWGASPTSPPLTMSLPTVRAWGFSQDGHDFYVLRLSDIETLIYDATTQMWASWLGGDSDYWRANYGTNWQGLSKSSLDNGATSDVVCGDDETGTLWTLDPDQGFDDGVTGDTTPIVTRATAGVPIRGSKSYRVFRVFLSMQAGDPTVTDGYVNLAVSDDNGVTFEDCGDVAVQDTVPEQDIVWRSLGSMDQPGRIFQFTDNGSSARWDGADVESEGLGDK